MHTVIVALAALAAWTLAGTTPAFGQLPVDAPQHRLLATSHGVTLQAYLGGWCRTVTFAGGLGSGQCADAVLTATPTRLPVHRGGTIELVTGVAVATIAARHADLDTFAPTDLPVAPLDATARRFAVRLPAGATRELLLVSIGYRDVAGAAGTRESGSADFVVGLVEQKVRPRGVTALTRVECGATQDGGRRCRLIQRGRIRHAAQDGLNCRRGSVVVRVFAGDRRALRARVTTDADCTYRLRSRAFSLPSGLARVVVKTRFLGSATLGSRSAPAARVAPRVLR